MRHAEPRGAFLVLMALGVVLVGGQEPQAAAAARSWREMRFEGVIGQADWYTCGPAAAATLLHHYFGIPATEEEMLAKAAAVMQAGGRDPRTGITAQALVSAMGELGLTVRGYRVLAGDLAEYFHRGGLPVIVHVTRPEPHYVVVVGLVAGRWLVADPSWGRRLFDHEELLDAKGFSGVVLVPVPGPDLAPVARERQANALAWAASRLEQLERWGGGRL